MEGPAPASQQSEPDVTDGSLDDEKFCEIQEKGIKPNFPLIDWLCQRLGLRSKEQNRLLFRSGLDAYDRHELVLLSSAYGLPVVGKRRETIPGDVNDASGTLIPGSGQFEPKEFQLLDGKPGEAIYRPTPLDVTGGGIAETQFRGHVCSFGLWSVALSADRIRAVSQSLEFFDDACIAWYGLGDSMRLSDSLLGSPLIVRGGGSVQEVVGPISAPRDAMESHAHARFKMAATTVPASAAWASARMETIDGADTGSAEATSDTSQLRAALRVLRPGMEAVDLDQLVSNLARQSAAAPPTAYGVQTTPKAALLATTALSSQCGGALVAIICDVVAIILSAAGFPIGASLVRKAIGGPITRNLPKLIKTLKTIDFAKVEGVRRSTPIFLRLVSALFGTTSGMPSFRGIIQSIFSEFRWWDIAFFAANVGLLVTSIIFTGGGAVIVILAT